MEKDEGTDRQTDKPSSYWKKYEKRELMHAGMGKKQKKKRETQSTKKP